MTTVAEMPEDITGWQVLIRTRLQVVEPETRPAPGMGSVSMVRVLVEYSVDGGASWHEYDPDGGIVLADDVPDDAHLSGT